MAGEQGECRLHVRGQCAVAGVVSGECYVITWDADLAAQILAMPQGAIIVAGQTRPQLMPALRKAAGIITDEGGVLSHAAIVSRELNVPCIIGAKHATKVLKSGMRVTMDATRGAITILE